MTSTAGPVRAARLHRPRPAARSPLALESVPVPEPGPGAVRLRVEACAVCRTDLQLAEGDLAARTLPVVPGHQIVGIVDAVGPGGNPADLGRRVGVAWLAHACGACRFCRSGRENLCEQARFTGWDVDGGYADLVVADAAFTYPVPDVDPVAVAPLLCGGAIGLR